MLYDFESALHLDVTQLRVLGIILVQRRLPFNKCMKFKIY